MCKHKNGLFLFYANSLPGRRFVMSGSVSPLPWTGNKGCIYTTIDAFMPPHRTYVEACMGSAEVFLRKKPVEKEIINDYNGDLVRFFRVLQRNENLERLIGRLFLSFNSEQIFRANKALLAEVPNILDDLTETSVIIENIEWNDFDLAVAFYENQVFSFSSTGKNFAITKKDMTKRFGRLIAACARLRNATIMHRDYKDCISYSAGEDAFILLDPPYKGTEDYYQKSSFGSDEHAKLFGFMNEVHEQFISHEQARHRPGCGQCLRVQADDLRVGRISQCGIRRLRFQRHPSPCQSPWHRGRVHFQRKCSRKHPGVQLSLGRL